MFPLLESSMCLVLSLVKFYLRIVKGPFQQKRECIHSDNGKRGCKFGSGNRGPCGATVVLQYHAKWCRIHIPTLLEPAAWLRYWGLDEAYVYQHNLMDISPA